MAKKPQVDIRRLKDEVAEFLKKSKWEKAAETLEQLIAVEPKDMSHRLRLGETYRRLEQPDKAVASYQHAAKFFSDEDQLIKAIGAVKIILELDPRNAEAQRQLQDINRRRFGKVTVEGAGLKARRAAAAARPEAIELDDEDIVDAGGAEAPEAALDEDEPLELAEDELPARKASASAAPALPHRGFQGGTRPPAPKAKSYDLGGGDDLELELDEPAAPAGRPPRAAAPPRQPRELVLDVDESAPERLPDDAILTPQAEDLALHDSEEVIPLDEDLLDAPAPPPSRPAAPRRPAPPKAVRADDEINLEIEAPAPRRKGAFRPSPQPIADLLSDDVEEEVELVSASSEDGRGSGPESQEPPEDPDLDAAFGNIAPSAGRTKKTVPTKRVPLFDDLSQDAFIELVNRVQYHRHVPGQLIIREGDPGHSFYVIIEGKVRVYKVGADRKEITLAHLGEGAFFGEMALLSGAPRTANVVAEEDTEILEVTDVVLRELAGKYPQVVTSLKNFYRQRLLNNVMAISPLFKDFDPAERKGIVEKFRMKQAGDAEVLIAEGKNSDGLYVVLHGAVEVTVVKDGHAVELARLKEGDIFGEMSLLTRDPAAATVTSRGNSILLRLPRENFQELAVTHPQILELVSELNERRKKATGAIL